MLLRFQKIEIPLIKSMKVVNHLNEYFLRALLKLVKDFATSNILEVGNMTESQIKITLTPFFELEILDYNHKF